MLNDAQLALREWLQRHAGLRRFGTVRRNAMILAVAEIVPQLNRQQLDGLRKTHPTLVMATEALC